MFVLLYSLALGSFPRCLATPNHGVCLFPKSNTIKHVSVLGDEDPIEACCAACGATSGCVSWLLYTGKKDRFPNGTCFLKDIVQKRPSTPSPLCVSAVMPAPTPSPSPPAPRGAKNVLFFAVDDLRPEISVDYFGPVPGTAQPTLHTPNFDKLAKKSLVLVKNYVQQAVCSPTRQSLLTSRRPDRTRVYDLYSNFRTVAANYTTLPEHFLNNGYVTVGMGKIFHPGHASGAGLPGGSDDGCCSWTNGSQAVDSDEIAGLGYYHAPNLKAWSGQNGSFNDARSWFIVPHALEAEHPLPDNQTADHAIKTLSYFTSEYQRYQDAVAEAVEKREPAPAAIKPWFLAVGFHKPHLPFVASEQFFAKYPTASISLPPDQQPPEGMPPVAWSSYGELTKYIDQASLKPRPSGMPGTVLPHEDVLELRRAYYASITQTDAMLGKVLDALAASPFQDNTVIAIWGDHGEHGEWCKHTNFELATRAPMMISVPGLTDQGIVTKHYSEHVDLFPTLSEAAMGIEVPFCPPGDLSFKVKLCTEGISLVQLMRTPSKSVKSASFSQYPRPYQGDRDDRSFVPHLSEAPSLEATTSSCIKDITQPGNGKGCTMGYTMVTLDVDGCEYRYTEWADFNTKGYPLRVNFARNVGVELYNHSADPGENINLNVTKKGDRRVEALSKRLSIKLRAGTAYPASPNDPK